MPPGSSYTPLGIATIYHTPSTGSGAHPHHCNPLTPVSSSVTVNSAANAFNIVDGATATYGADPATVTATVLVTGLSTDESDLVSLTGGSSKSFRIVVTGISTGGSADVLDILRTVPASSEQYITVTGTDGSTSTFARQFEGL